jgi:hypothetical protein
MKKAIVLMLSLILLIISGCFSDKQAEKPAVAISQPAQIKGNPKEPEKSKTLESSQVGAQQKITYQPTQARSKQKVIATFEIGSNICVINGGPLTMETIVITHDSAVFVPARYFALAIGIPEGRYELKNPNEISFSYNNKTVTGQGQDLIIQGKRIYHYGQTLYIDSNGVPFVRLHTYAEALGFDVATNRITKKIDLLEGLPLAEDDLVLASLRPGMKEKQVLNLLGQPDKINSFKSGNDLLYPNMKIYAESANKAGDEWTIATITVKSDQYMTKRGVKVGDSIEKVINLYGMGYIFWDDRNQYSYKFISSIYFWQAISFKVEEGKISEIEVANLYLN